MPPPREFSKAGEGYEARGEKEVKGKGEGADPGHGELFRASLGREILVRRREHAGEGKDRSG